MESLLGYSWGDFYHPPHLIAILNPAMFINKHYNSLLFKFLIMLFKKQPAQKIENLYFYPP